MILGVFKKTAVFSSEVPSYFLKGCVAVFPKNSKLLINLDLKIIISGALIIFSFQQRYFFNSRIKFNSRFKNPPFLIGELKLILELKQILGFKF
jgi:hypothetical protein